MAEKKRSKKADTSKPKASSKAAGFLRLPKRKNRQKDETAAKKERRFHIFPKFLRNAWAEIKQVTWPSRKETARLTVAVLIFSIIFGAFVAALDFGLDRLFKEVILG
jgi:preprotein translocase subunit SecE